MRRKALITIALASVLTLAGCTQREVTKVDPLNIPIEETEPVKPAEPIVINVVPELEVEDSDNNIEISADIDYYGKEEATQPAPATPNTGFPAVSEPITSQPENHYNTGDRTEDGAIWGFGREIKHGGGTW